MADSEDEVLAEETPTGGKDKEPTYKATTILLGLTLLLVLTVFFSIRIIEKNNVKKPVAETFSISQTIPDKSQPREKININTASEAELTALPGIGEGKAADIVEYRKEYGLFDSIEDIMKVSGVGEGIFEKIKDSICVE